MATMATVVALVIGIVALAFLLWRRGPEPLGTENRRGQWLLWLAMAPLGLMTGFLLVMGIGEIVSGDFSGIIHVVPALAIAIMAFLANRRPREGGFVLVAIGIFSTLLWGRTLFSGDPWGVLVMAGPFLLAGILLVFAGSGQRRLGGAQN